MGQAASALPGGDELVTGGPCWGGRGGSSAVLPWLDPLLTLWPHSLCCET